MVNWNPDMLQHTLTALFAFSLALLVVAPTSPAADASNQIQKGEMAAYLLVLAELDPALIVTPPPGLEVGYVPIVTRQAAKE